MKTFVPSELGARERHHYILGTIGPRPIAFASTIDKDGRPNLAPYSFFNVFSSTPPVLIFSANTRVRDGKQKDTLRNIQETGEVVINLVSYPMARQMAIAGLDYDQGVNEFEKAGLTPIASQMIKPFRVKESPVHFECKLLEVKAMSDKPGAANLIMVEVVLMHLDESIIMPDNKIDPQQLDIVGRLGAFNYSRVYGNSVFEIVQPRSGLAIGFDALPESVRSSKILSGHELALLAGLTEFPGKAAVEEFAATETVTEFLAGLPVDQGERTEAIHNKIREYLEKETPAAAMKLIAACGLFL
jgi:flavin reductase (DIM6/NTAB) family NADH-FMN oxidoreductase RutF